MLHAPLSVIQFSCKLRSEAGCFHASSLFNTSMECVSGRVVEQSHHGASRGNTKLIDLAFFNEAVIFDESLEVLQVEASWVKQSTRVHACGEDIGILKNFTYMLM